MDFIIDILNDMNATRWIIVGIVVLGLELATGTTYLLWPALAALVVGVFNFLVPVMGWEMQFLQFFGLSIVFLIVGHIYVRPRMKSGDPSDLNDPARAMIGRRVMTLTDFEAGEGRVKVGDTQWRALVEEGNLSANVECVVMAVRGTTLIVEPV